MRKKFESKSKYCTSRKPTSYLCNFPVVDGYVGIHALWFGEMDDSPYPITIISAEAEDKHCSIRMESQIFNYTSFARRLSPEVCIYIYGILEKGKVKAQKIDVLYEELIGRY